MHRGVGAAQLAAGSFGAASNAVGAITTAPTLVGGAVFAAGSTLSYNLAASGSEKFLGSYTPTEATAVERSFERPTQSYAKEQGTILAVEAATTAAATVVGKGASKAASRAVAKHRARTSVRAAPKASAVPPTKTKTVQFQKDAGKQTHKNSHEYKGETHVYRILDPEGKTFKIGESARGYRKRDGASIRAEEQARRLNRQPGQRDFDTEIRHKFTSKKEAYDFEGKLIERFRRVHGRDTLPGNKGKH